MELEVGTGLSVLSGELNPFQLSAKTLRYMAYLLLKRAGASCSERDIGRELSNPETLRRVRGDLAAAWRAALPEADEDREDREGTDDGGKARTWMDIWADNRQCLGVSDADWLSYTPRMVQQLSRERLKIVQTGELMLSRVAATVANYGFCRPSKLFDDDYFMVHPPKKRKAAESGELLTGDDIALAFSGFKQCPIAGQLAGAGKKKGKGTR